MAAAATTIAILCLIKVITLIGSNKGNYFENATACSKRMRKTLVATQLKMCDLIKAINSR